MIRESLTGGTEHCIDHHAERLLGRAVRAGDRFSLVISSKQIKHATTTFQWVHADDLWPTANYYVDTKASREQGKAVKAWLCPLLQPLFNGVAPETLWVEVKHPKWKRDRLKHLVLPFEDPTHPLHYNKAAVEEEFDDLFL